jgi:hypothetical protein
MEISDKYHLIEESFVISLRTKWSVLGIWYSLHDTETLERMKSWYNRDLVENLRSKWWSSDYQVFKSWKTPLGIKVNTKLRILKAIDDSPLGRELV